MIPYSQKNAFLYAALAVVFWFIAPMNAFAGSCLLPAPQGCSGTTPDTQARCIELGGIYYTAFDCAGPPASSPTAPPPTETGGLPVEPVTPRLQIPIPGLPQLSNVSIFTTEGRRVADIPFLAEYLSGVYRFLVGLAGLAATVMIIIGGMRWLLAAGDAGKIGAAKETITSAAVGLTIALGSYLVLFVLNPELVTFRSLRVGITNPETSDVSGAEGSEETDPASLGACGAIITAAAAGTCPLSEKLFLSNQLQCGYHFALGCQSPKTCPRPASDYAAIRAADLKGGYGTTVSAPISGTVDIAGPKGNCGNMVRIVQENPTDSSKEFRVKFCHLSEINVTVGQTVSRGQVVGKSGGNCCSGQIPPTGSGWGAINTKCDGGTCCNKPTPCQTWQESGNTTGEHLHMETNFPMLPCLEISS